MAPYHEQLSHNFPARGAILESNASRSQSQSGRGFFTTMTKKQIMAAVLEIIKDERDLEALKSLIEERKEFLEYRAIEKEIYFGNDKREESDK